jgi:hypothetical protein
MYYLKFLNHVTFRMTTIQLLFYEYYSSCFSLFNHNEPPLGSCLLQLWRHRCTKFNGKDLHNDLEKFLVHMFIREK